MGKHTPGPWKWVAVDGGWDGVAEESNPSSVICKLVLNVDANARLIAAAPDLLEVVIEADAVLQLVGRISPFDVPLEGSLGYKLRAAIAKVTGESP